MYKRKIKKKAKLLLRQNPTINIENLFIEACKYEQLHVAKWLLKIKPTININIYKVNYCNKKTKKWLLLLKNNEFNKKLC